MKNDVLLTQLIKKTEIVNDIIPIIKNTDNQLVPILTLECGVEVDGEFFSATIGGNTEAQVMRRCRRWQSQMLRAA